MSRFIKIFSRQPSEVKLSKRTVCVYHRCPPTFEYVQEIFPDNKIITSKYTAWNFLFKNLFEQFRRIANFYFLLIAITQLSINSPVSPFTSLLPLIFVVSVTAIKQAYEDWLRHKSDNLVNHRSIFILRKGRLVPVKAQDIKVGDIVMVSIDKPSPCDLVILSTSNLNGHCHITTANLDGETNLKDQICAQDTRDYRTPELLESLSAVIECDLPTPDLYRFHGNITVYDASGGKNTCSLSSKNLFLKGATLKNTRFVYGCAIYTGIHSKLVLNLKFTSNKFSSVEKSLNKFLIIFLIVLVMKATICTTLFFVFEEDLLDEWYIPKRSQVSASVVVADFLSFTVLLNYIIPISLYVTLDLIKFIGTLFFVWDLDMYDERIDEPAICNSSDLNEELGQVEYLFTDKTGTLTENCMVFRECSILGVKYMDTDGVLQICDGYSINKSALEHFLLVLVLCNTVQIYEKNDKGQVHIEYFASSPDEKALVEACARYGVVLKEITDTTCKVSVFGAVKEYKKLCTLEFDADRKRMSTIVEDSKGTIRLLCKGADSHVLNILRSKEQEKRDVIQKHVREYALTGLRTLVIAEKEISRREYETFSKSLRQSECQIENREVMVSNTYRMMEQNLGLLGATAVQDRLQEYVADTIESLRMAGIKVWILTGDHVDTALNISYACGHIKSDMIKLSLLEQEDTDYCFYTLRRHQYNISEKPHQTYFLVVDGVSIGYAYKDHTDLLRSVSESCIAVLCCRMSPLQKSQIVKLIKHSSTSPITAAIGDGANDVSMIQEAHVGIGIIGHEGRQAVNCSDFAFSRFYYLKKALLVHGQYYYTRAAITVQYFFYKNVAFVIPQFFFIFNNHYTPQSLYGSVFLMMYNLCFTAAPIFLYGCTEKHLSVERLLNTPNLYNDLSRNCLLTYGQFLKWILHGLWHGIVLFFGTYLLWDGSPTDPESGQTLDIYSFGTTMFAILVVIANLKLCLHTRYWTFLFIGFQLISIFGFVFFTLFYSTVYWSVGSSLLYGVYNLVISSGEIHFATILLIIVALIPDLLMVLSDKYDVKPWSAITSVYQALRNPHKYFQFHISNPIKEPGIALSRINIIADSAETVS